MYLGTLLSFICLVDILFLTDYMSSPLSSSL